MRVWDRITALCQKSKIHPREWIGDLARQPHKVGLKINMKPNLLPDRLKEYPIG
jgi:hypothetical protein